jgi:hypothetical protein
MASEAVEEGFDVFVHDGEKAFGAVRHVSPRDITIYVEDAGDFVVSREAIKDVYSEKVVLNYAKLDAKLRGAIDRAHKHEDPTI